MPEKKQAPEQNEDTAALARLLCLHAPQDGKHALAIPGVFIARASGVNAEPNRVVSQLGLCIVAQGAKRVLVGEKAYEYDASRLAVYSAETPATTNIIRASKAEPYLCLVVAIDPQRLSDLALKVYPGGAPRVTMSQPLQVGQKDPDIVKAAVRLMEMMAQPQDAALLAPLVIDEMLIRLLRGPFGPAIAQLGASDSHVHKIARTISWLRAHYAEPLTVESLAKIAGMSPTSFHQHFKSVTSMSPLQFQKALRLQEARHLLLSRAADVSAASLQVGYASLSQFSREYSRFFGSSPTRDIAKLREQPISVNA
jgi:AraC-like DNA-binding protein